MAITAAVLAIALAAPLHAGPVIDWDPAFFYEPGVTFSNSIPGNEMKIVGIISAFGPPLQFLNANDPSKDYTFYLSGMISNGTTVIGSAGSQFYVTTYTGGTIQVYEGTPRNAVFDPNPPNANVPSTFTDGTVLLSGNVSGFYTQTNDFTTFMTGNAEGNITWTGGTLISYLSSTQGPCPALFTGGLTWYPSLLIPGYVFRHTGKIDNDCPSPTRQSTWGRIKSLYR
ncbi:MAG: hypothetical protein HYR74_12485 [Candidatus Eisenbacteria bacterium]|nr:hypothetical protein [Candidatus Eisenbacteria bacterium]